MAEERIICLQIGLHLRNCPLMKNSGYCILDCGCDQLEGVKCNKGFTRTEAIELMAKGLAKYNDQVKSGQTAEEIWNKTLVEETKSFYLRQAEVALDALIKGE